MHEVAIEADISQRDKTVEYVVESLYLKTTSSQLLVNHQFQVQSN